MDNIKLTASTEKVKKRGWVIPTDIYEDGNLKAIEFNTPEGEFVIEASWDERDAQTSENRVIFRKWAYNFVKDSLGYTVKK